MNMYKIIYPLLECRSWLLFVCFFVKKNLCSWWSSWQRCSFDCYSPVVKCSHALQEPLLSEGSPSHPPPHPTHNSYVITLFADATIIPFTLSADATITSWTPIKITSIICTSVWKYFFLYADLLNTLFLSLNGN